MSQQQPDHIPPTTDTTIPQTMSDTTTPPHDNDDIGLLQKKKRQKPNNRKQQLSFDDLSNSTTATNDSDPFGEDHIVSLATGQVDHPTSDIPNPTATNDDASTSLKFIDVAANEKRVQNLIKQIEDEWDRKQEEIKKELLTVVFSWWDGSGHRMEVTINKGSTISQFLGAAQKAIVEKGFGRVATINPGQLMYVKEDLIIPLHYTFYDFIASNARGKSGSLVHFGVQEDIRLEGTSSGDRDDIHAGKIMEKAYFEANKQHHPYNRFETFDPKKSYDKYTIA